jgi:GT2 family glycosyltransferase
MTTRTPDLSISIVTFHRPDLFENLYRTIPSAIGDLSAEILVVDNASGAEMDGVFNRLTGIELIRNPTNRFFTAAENQNLGRASGAFTASVNPDVELGGESLAKMVEFLRRNPDVGAVTPRFVYPDGTSQGGIGRFPSVAFGICEVSGINRRFPDNAVNRKMWDGSQDRAAGGIDGDPEVLYGACIVTRREVLDKVGLKDEQFVHGWDEYDWCHRVRKAGWRLAEVRDAVVTHHKGATRMHQSHDELDLHHWQGMYRLYRKHHGETVYRLLRCVRPVRCLLA